MKPSIDVTSIYSYIYMSDNPDFLPIRKPLGGAGCRKQGSLHIEPKESRPVLWSELKADAAIDHRYGIRVQGEG